MKKIRKEFIHKEKKRKAEEENPNKKYFLFSFSCTLLLFVKFCLPNNIEGKAFAGNPVFYYPIFVSDLLR